jgi:methionyl-tRNA formyltransferase
VKIVFFGTPEFAIPTLDRLLGRSDIEVVGVVTQPDKKRGRGDKLVPSPVKKVAIDRDIPIWQPARIKKDPETISALNALAADFFVVIAYGQILSPEILDLPKFACINVHGSLLPAYRGAAPIQRCLTDGVTETGITTMLMDAGMDTGAMLLTAKTEISPLDRADEVTDRLANIGADLLIETITNFTNINPISQDNNAATHAPPIKKPEYLLDLNTTAISIHDRVRGFYPDCYLDWQSQPLKILATVPILPIYLAALPIDIQPKINNAIGDLPTTIPPAGTIVKIVKGIGPIIATGEGYLLIREAQPPNKRPQSGADIVNGLRLAIGDRF